MSCEKTHAASSAQLLAARLGSWYARGAMPSKMHTASISELLEELAQYSTHERRRLELALAILRLPESQRSEFVAVVPTDHADVMSDSIEEMVVDLSIEPGTPADVHASIDWLFAMIAASKE